jgi:CDP-4-dehydro-6-deoxyglucose reductase, E3
MTLSPTPPVSPTSLTSAQGASIPVVLRGSKVIAPSVKELTFERCDGQPLEFAPGQWVNLLIPAASGEFKRAYSVASEPNGGPSFELAVTHVEGGPGSTHLHAMRPGDKLAILGPHGLFQRKGERPTIFVGTGTGITPLRSMFRAALRGSAMQAAAREPLWLLFGVRHSEDQLYLDEFSELALKHSNFRAEYTLSRPTEQWSGRSGYVQTHLRQLYCELASGLAPPIAAAAQAGDFSQLEDLHHAQLPAVYICGLTKMVTAVRDLLRKELGLPRTAVHSERYD